MLKQKVYNWEDTNLFLIGSDLDKNARLDSAETEKAWDGVGKRPELKVWRIEKFKVKAWPESKHGQFHVGDSYIVLHTYKDSDDKEKLNYDIYFWIGEDSSQDEYGTAAYKTVELDAKLMDAAVQHREVQNHETKAFKDLFGGTIEYLPGGVETGFNHVGEPRTKEPELFRVKGTKGNIEFKPIKRRRDYMNSNDVFILDNWLTIYQWNGKHANAHEKLKAGAYLDSVVNARGGKCKKVVLDEGNKDDECTEFWAQIPGDLSIGCVTLKTYTIKDSAENYDEDVKPFRKQLFRLTDRSGSLKFHRVAKADLGKGNKLPKDKLNSDDVYILDDGFIVWVWIGKGSSSQERGMGMGYAMKYLKTYNRHPYLPIAQVSEGNEPLTFTESLHNDPSSSCSIM